VAPFVYKKEPVTEQQKGSR